MENKKEMVNSPSHYNADGRKECIVQMCETFGVVAVVIFCVLNAYKYEYRCGLKDGNPEEQEKAKVRWYCSYACRKLLENDYARRIIKWFFPNTMTYLISNSNNISR